MTPIQLYTYGTPNGRKASIMLEECGLPYEVRIVDIERGMQHEQAFLALNPNNKIPVIHDPDAGRTVFESGAILLYLAGRSGRFLPEGEADRTTVMQWMLFQAAHVGPTLGQLWNYRHFVSPSLPQVIDRFERETGRVLRVLDGQLRRHPHIAGEAFGLADIMTWPWIQAALDHLGVSLDATPDLSRWHAAVGSRPAVRRGAAVPPSKVALEG